MPCSRLTVQPSLLAPLAEEDRSLCRRASFGVILGLSTFLPVEARAELATEEADEPPKQADAPPSFNTHFLFGGAHSADLQEFLAGSNVLPGEYRVDVRINRELIGRQLVTFASTTPGEPAAPCLTLRLLENSGIDFTKLIAEGAINADQPDACLDLTTLIPQSTIEYDSNRLQLTLSVPQAWMKRGPRGYVSPELWDEGVPAGFVNYNFSARGNQTAAGNNDSLYLGLSSGVNLGMWRFRNESTISQATGRERTATSNRTFVERDLTLLKSQLTVGEAYDNTQIFDSFRFRGLSLRSDDAMLPDSQRGYAPVIRGTAESNATVEIRQNDYLLIKTEVSPGPFVISDIFPSGSNGDLEITIIEADGRRRVTTQAFASLPRMVREGMSRYTFAAGRFAGLAGDSEPAVMTASLTHGVTAETTVYGGWQWSESFRAANLGITRNTPIGAVSADITHSVSAIPARQNKGQSARLLYSKTFNNSATSFTLASYRYSTDGYRSLADHVRDQDLTDWSRPVGRARSRFDLTVNQQLGGRRGTAYLSSSQQRYWNLPGSSEQITAGYSNSWKDLNYNIGLSHSRVTGGSSDISTPADTSLTISLSLPIGSSASSTRSSFSTVLREKGEYTAQSGVNGRFMGDPDSHYSVNVGTQRGRGETASASLSTRTSVAALNLGYSAGDGYSSTSAGASGAIVVHGGGINLGQPVGDTFALAHVEGIKDARLANSTATTGANGYAIVPNVTPYRNNWIRLDTRDLGADIEIDSPSQQVVPRRGSVTKAVFAAQKGRRVQFELRRADGSKIPFGSTLLDADDKELGMVDPFGNALALVNQDSGTLKVNGGGASCSLDYSLGKPQEGVMYERLEAVCR